MSTSSSDSDTDLVHVRVSTLDDPDADDDHDMIVVQHDDEDEDEEEDDDIQHRWMEPVYIVQHQALQHIQQQQQTTTSQTQSPASGTNTTTATTTTTTKTPTPTTITTSPSPAAVATSSSPQPQQSPAQSPTRTLTPHTSPPLSHIIIPTYIHPSSPVPPSPSLASTIPLSTPSHAITDDIMRPSPSNPVLQQGIEMRPLPSDHPSPTHTTSTPTSPTSTPHILCGPIIGRITHDTVRILIEVSHACILTMTVVMEGNTVVTVTAPPSPSIHESHPVTSTPLPISHSHTQSLSANTPTIYVIPHLHPHTRYHITCTCDINLNNIQSCHASFQTTSIETTSLRIAMAADHHSSSTSSSPSTSSTSSLWHHLSSHLRDIDLLLLHLPIDTHTLYQQCINIYNQHTDTSTASHACIAYLSQQYRSIWTSLSHILSHIQTLCIPHRPFTSISTSSPIHQHIIHDITYAQKMYERQLWDDIDDRKEENATTPVDDASSYHVWNQIGVILLSPHTSSLSRFTHELTSGMISHVSHLIVALDQPLVVRGQRRVCICDGICRTRKYQTPPLASSSLQSSILDTLTTWLRQSSSRYVTVLTSYGEQSAATTEIRIDDATSSLVIPHITSGPMSSSPPSALSHTLTLALRACGGDRITPHHTLSSTSYTRSRCFALLHAMTSHNSSSSIRTLMITDETNVKQKSSLDVELESRVEKDRRVSNGTGDEKTLV